MTMQILGRSAFGLLAAALLATQASAADFVGTYTLGDSNFVFTTGSSSSSTATAAYFNGYSGAGTFDDTYTFTFTQDGTGSANISTSFSSSDTMLTITNVIINGTDYGAPASTGTGQGWTINDIFVTGSETNTIEILGTVSGSGTYSGNLTFQSASAVPELGVWVMMIAGFGASGIALRRRREQVPRCVAVGA